MTIEDAGLDIEYGDGSYGDAEERALRALKAHQGASPEDIDADLAAIQGQVAAAAPDSTMDGPPELDGKAVTGRVVVLKGKKFRVRKKVGLMPMLKFSAYADVETQDPRALGAMYMMLKDCIVPDEWRAFEDHATDSQADADELLDVITQAMQIIAGRPTEPPVPSSDGRRAISGGSTASSSARRARGSRR